MYALFSLARTLIVLVFGFLLAVVSSDNVHAKHPAERSAMQIERQYSSARPGNGARLPIPYMEARDMGVWQCTMTMHRADFPSLEGLTNTTSFQLHVFLKHMLSRDSGNVTIKATFLVEVPVPQSASQPELTSQPAKPQPNTPQSSIYLEPELALRQVHGRDVIGSWPLWGSMRFPLFDNIMPFTSPGNVTFTPLPSESLEYVVTALDGGHGKKCVFRPLSRPRSRLLDPEHGEPPPIGSERLLPTRAVVVVHPLWDISAASTGLLSRHIQHYAMLGFTRYLLYVRPRHLDALLSSALVAKWLRQGMLRLVRWDAVQTRPGAPYWDQRLVYNHAVMAHLGENTFLAMLDLDEYLVSMRPMPSTVFDMVRECNPPNEPVSNLEISRNHVIAEDWPNRTRGELPLWLSSSSDHPIFQYKLIDMDHPPGPKTMVIPDAVEHFFVHTAKSYKPHNVPSQLDPACMLLAHVKNLHRPRQSDPKHLALRFHPEAVWGSALGHLRERRLSWLASGLQAGSAASVVRRQEAKH